MQNKLFLSFMFLFFLCSCSHNRSVIRITEKSYNLASKQAIENLSIIASKLVKAIQNEDVELFNKQIKVGSTCVDEHIEVEELKHVLDDKESFLYHYLFDANWKKKYLTRDDFKYTITYPSGQVESRRIEEEPVGYAEFLKSNKNNTIKVYIHEFTWSGGAWIAGYVEFYFKHPFLKTQFELSFDKKRQDWNLTSGNWYCDD